LHAGKRIERKRFCARSARTRPDQPLESTDGAIREARRLYAEDPDRYFYPDQYNNDANGQAQYDTTAPEIIEQTSGRLTHFVAGLGTSGTFVGTGRRLRKFSAAIKLISFQPDSAFHGLEGLKHMGSAIVPGIYDPTLADEDLRIDTERSHDGAPPRSRRRTARGDLLGCGGCGDARRRQAVGPRRHRHRLSGRRRKISERNVLDDQ
jgi:cysteine synthase B